MRRRHPDQLGHPDDHLTSSFGGTSGATAIVAGAAVLLQSWAKKYRGGPFDPATLRGLLSNPYLNTPSAQPLNDRIGVMPDLTKIVLDQTLRLLPPFGLLVEILWGVIQDGGGAIRKPGGGIGPVGPWGPDIELTAENRDMLLGFAIAELSKLLSDRSARKAIGEAALGVVQKAVETMRGGRER
jgi:hypothetical protein